jgi:hypothetical protein
MMEDMKFNFKLDDRILVLLIPLLFIVGGIIAANFAFKAIFGISISELPFWGQFLFHMFGVLLLYKLVRMVVS